LRHASEREALPSPAEEAKNRGFSTMIGPLTYLDAALLAVGFISGLLAMYRGLTRELLSILSWIVAAAAALWGFLSLRKLAEEMAQQMGTQVPIAQIVISGLIFLFTLIVVHLITARISDSILDSRVGMIDRVLEFVFGVARGFILIVIPYMLFSWFIPDLDTRYDWVGRSVSLPHIKSSGNALHQVMLEKVLPIFERSKGEQQGARILHDGRSAALALGMAYHISVTRHREALRSDGGAEASA